MTSGFVLVRANSWIVFKYDAKSTTPKSIHEITRNNTKVIFCAKPFSTVDSAP